ncbi:MAG: restriction endonuclease [Candidatus Riflebacteria bacterium]|nr:restriction endonuclease [Candidatus Riflebacteria bacterium]
MSDQGCAFEEWGVFRDGKDGGVDIIAYRDPLGTESPRIKIQIKHRETPANVQELR